MHCPLGNTLYSATDDYELIVNGSKQSGMNQWDPDRGFRTIQGLFQLLYLAGLFENINSTKMRDCYCDLIRIYSVDEFQAVDLSLNIWENNSCCLLWSQSLFLSLYLFQDCFLFLILMDKIKIFWRLYNGNKIKHFYIC